MFRHLAMGLLESHDESMEIRVLPEPFCWSQADRIPLQEICHDWHGRSIAPPAGFALLEDPVHLWLLACRESPANAHPAGDCGDFQAGLWKYDVAELFIAPAGGVGYLEFNLSPRGAWWVERFCAPRQLRPLDGLPGVVTHACAAGPCGWRAALGIPLGWLREEVAWGDGVRANVNFILESPQQLFLSACDLGGGEPDFHRPSAFARLRRLGG